MKAGSFRTWVFRPLSRHFTLILFLSAHSGYSIPFAIMAAPVPSDAANQAPIADTTMDIDMDLDLGPEPEPEPEPEPIQTVSALG